MAARPYVFLLVFFMLSLQAKAQQELFEKLNQLEWKVAFRYSGSEDWQQKWFLDGQRAEITNMPDGMLFEAGPIERDNASHAVLWTKQTFQGDLKIEFNFTRMDDITKYVNIIYIQASGAGPAPYVQDIAEWSALRTIPYMRSYFLHMNLWHVSFAAFGNEEGPKPDYVRARRYPVAPGGNFTIDTQVGESYDDTGLFEPGVTHHITFIKKDSMLYMKVQGNGKEKMLHWDFSAHAPLSEGRIGLRHMWTRCSKYANFVVSTLNE